jgi:hypothetical protein
MLLDPLALEMSIACLAFPNCPYFFERVRKSRNEALLTRIALLALGTFFSPHFRRD